MLLRAALLVLLATLAAAVPASAAPVLRDAGPAVRPLAVDGGAVFFAVQHGGPVRGRDERGRVLGETAAPRTCTFAGAGGVALLWNCPGAGGSAEGLVVDRRTGARSVLAPPPGGDATESTHWEAIGSRWLAARAVGYHYSNIVYVDRATGRVERAAPTEGDDRVPDLDRRGLYRTLCRPARVRMVPDTDHLGLEPGPYAFRAPYGATRAYTESSDGDQTGQIVLDRCGAPPRTLSRCARGCATDPRLGAHAVAWLEGAGRVRAHLLAGRRTLTWSLPGVEDVAVVGRRLYAVAGGRLKTLTLPR